MVSKSTKTVASRIPLDLFFQLQKEAEELHLNMKDYLMKIIESRNENPDVEPSQDKQYPAKEKVIKQPKKKSSSPGTNTMEIFFSED